MELESIRPRVWRDAEGVATWTNAEVWKRRVAGMPAAKIADDLGITTDAVQEALQLYVDARVVESDQVAKALELDRLDALFGLAVALAQEGDGRALAEARKLSESRRILLGLNAPDKREISMAGKSEVDENIESLLREMEDL